LITLLRGGGGERLTPAAMTALPILMYHSISRQPAGRTAGYYETVTAPEKFRAQLECLKQMGYRGATLKDALARWNRGCGNSMPPRATALTFDDGYADFHENAWPILQECQFKATVFLPTAFIGEQPRRFENRPCLNWRQIADLRRQGIEFGSHTVSHPILVELTWPQIEEELSASKKCLEDQLGVPVDYFAYPYAFPQERPDFVQRFGEVLEQTGYQAAVTTKIGLTWPQDDLRALKRLPVNNDDTPGFLAAKLRGAYDWMGVAQRWFRMCRHQLGLLLFLAILFPVFLSAARFAGEWPDHLFEDQFEVGDLHAWFTRDCLGAGSRVEINEVHRHSGRFSAAFQLAPTNQARRAALIQQFPAVSPVHARVYLRISSATQVPIGQSLEIIGFAKTGVGLVCSLRLKRIGDRAYVLSQARLGDAKHEFTLDQWHCVEIHYQAGLDQGACRVWVDGELHLTGQGLQMPHVANELRAGVVQTVSAENSSLQARLFLDDVVVAGRSIGGEPTGVRLLCPDFRGRIGAPLRVVLTGWQPQDRIRVKLTNTNGFSRALADGLAPADGVLELKVSLRGLPRSRYQFTGELLGRDGRVKASESVCFDKNYDGDPAFSIDEDNNFTRHGKPFFLVTPFVLRPESARQWLTNRIINTLYGCDWNNKTVEGARRYLDAAQACGTAAFAPMPVSIHGKKKEAEEITASFLMGYVTNLHRHPALAGWVFIDEPELFHYRAADHRAWWEAAKSWDGSIITHVNLMGNTFGKSDHNIKLARTFCYPFLCADAMGFDMYPYEYTNTQSLTEMALHLERIQRWNHYLIPATAFIQCQDIHANKGGGAPTPRQILLMAWLAVIKGAKGIHWFHYFGPTPPESLQAMSQFGQQVEKLSAILLSPSLPSPIAAQIIEGPADSVQWASRRCQGTNYLLMINIAGQPVKCRFASRVFRQSQRVENLIDNTSIPCADGFFEVSIEPEGLRIYRHGTSLATESLPAIHGSSNGARSQSNP